jgi:hypothetical protein
MNSNIKANAKLWFLVIFFFLLISSSPRIWNVRWMSYFNSCWTREVVNLLPFLILITRLWRSVLKLYRGRLVNKKCKHKVGVWMRKSIKLYILLCSILLVLISSFIPIGIRTVGDFRFFGYPAEWLNLYNDGHFGFNVFGFVLNTAIFYLICLLIVKAFKKILLQIKK